MSRDDIQKLMGGYATGTLTPEEQQALFAAALDDQELFDELAKEQALHDLLRDPAARAHVLAAIDERPEPWWHRATGWIWRPAGVLGMAAGLAAIGGYAIWHARQTQAPVLVADGVRKQAAPAASVPAPEPVRPQEQKAAARAKRLPAGTTTAALTPPPAPAPPSPHPWRPFPRLRRA
jgi:hypothetical protein